MRVGIFVLLFLFAAVMSKEMPQMDYAAAFAEEENFQLLKAKSIIPDVDGFALEIGATADNVVMISNGGTGAYKVLGISGQVHSADNYESVLYNLTAQYFPNVVVKPESEVSIKYRYFVQDFWEPSEYRIVWDIYLQGGENLVMNRTLNIFNETVSFYQKEGSLDATALGTYAAIIAVAGYGVYRLLKARKVDKPESPKDRTVKQGKRGDEWGENFNELKKKN